jgi:hypothetical protein
MGRCLVLAVLAVVAWPAGATAAGRWSQPLAVAQTVRPTDVVDTVIAGGDAVVVWEDFDIVGSGRTTTTDNFALWVESAAIGQPFGAPRLLERTGGAPLAAVAASLSGWCAVAWQSGSAIRVALRPPGGVFGAPVTAAAVMPAGPVRVGIDDSGTVIVLWNEFGAVGSTTGPVRTATVGADGAVTIHDLGDQVLPGSWLALAVGGAGQAVAAWSGFPGPPGQGRGDARAALRPAGGEFGPATGFADPTANLGIAGASIDGAGRATVALHRTRVDPQPVPGDLGGVEILHGSTDAGWDAPRGLDPNVQTRNVRLVSNPRGDRAAVWDMDPRNMQEINASRVAPAPADQPFGPLLLSPMPSTADAYPGSTLGDVPVGAALDGAGEALVLWDGALRGMQVHPVSPTAQAGPPEPVLADACSGGGGRIAAAPSSTVAAIAYQGRPRGLWITYRDAGAAALEAGPRICEARWWPALPGVRRAPAGRIKLHLRLSKPVAHVAITVRDRHRRVLSIRRLGSRPVGYTSVTLRGRHSALKLPPGLYRITARIADAAGRRSPLTRIDLRVVRPRRSAR